MNKVTGSNLGGPSFAAAGLNFCVLIYCTDKDKDEDKDNDNLNLNLNLNISLKCNIWP